MSISVLHSFYILAPLLYLVSQEMRLLFEMKTKIEIIIA